ncbi:MAG: hypothetical protein AB2814_00255, partial [Candidatus Sedimenticola endophacoides]
MAERDPFSPYSLLWSFKQALDPFGLELVAKKVIYQAVTTEMFGGLGKLYGGLGQILRAHGQECRYLVKDFGTSQSPKSTRQRDSRYCPD